MDNTCRSKSCNNNGYCKILTTDKNILCECDIGYSGDNCKIYGM